MTIEEEEESVLKKNYKMLTRDEECRAGQARPGQARLDQRIPFLVERNDRVVLWSDAFCPYRKIIRLQSRKTE